MTIFLFILAAGQGDSMLYSVFCQGSVSGGLPYTLNLLFFFLDGNIILEWVVLCYVLVIICLLLFHVFTNYGSSYSLWVIFLLDILLPIVF